MNQAPQLNAQQILALDLPGIKIHRVHRLENGRLAVQFESTLSDQDTEEVVTRALQPMCPPGCWPEVWKPGEKP